MSQQDATDTFEALRREAKRLLRNCRERQPSAVSRIRACWPEAVSPDFCLKLTQAQLVVAREHGYRSWRHLRASVLADTERRRAMKVKAVVDETARLGAPGTTVHVLTGDQAQAEAVVTEAAVRWGAEAVAHLKAASTIPETRIVVGRWVEFCFAYGRQACTFLGPAAQSRLEEQDRLLAGASALIVEVPEEERRVPCLISAKERILAAVSFSELTGRYKTTTEIKG